MIKNTLLDRKIFWVIAITICTSIFLYIYVKHYLEIKKLLELSIESKNELNNSSLDYFTIWGAFGDYVGGSLNPIIGLISVFLLLMTWITTVKTLEHTKTELIKTQHIQKEIQKTQILQQFDSFFFSMLTQIKDYEKEMNIDEKLNSIYESFFVKNLPQNYDSIGEFDKNYELTSYFAIVFELLKNISERVEEDKSIDTGNKIAQNYVNIIKVTMPLKLQQLLMLKVCNSKKYRHYFVKYSFFDQTPFYNLKSNNNELSLLAVALIFIYKNLYVEDVKIKGISAFGDSKYIQKLKGSENFTSLFDLNNFQEGLINGSGIAMKLLPFGKYYICRFCGEHYIVVELKLNFYGAGIVISGMNGQGKKIIDEDITYSQVKFYYDYMLIDVNPQIKFRLQYIASDLRIQQYYEDNEPIDAVDIKLII